MNSAISIPNAAGHLSAGARARMRIPLFRADWMRTVFIHYEVEPEALQKCVPFELHLREGRAYVSLVAFTMERLGSGILESIGRVLLRPISDHGFLNARTYVRHNGEDGIYFLAEWLSNLMPVPLGRPLFGLPYRPGRLNYRHDYKTGEISGSVQGRGGMIHYHAETDPGVVFKDSEPGSLDEFLLERYTAFTHSRGRTRLFRVWHEPWPQAPIAIETDDDKLLSTTGGWHAHARVVGANYSPGVRHVWMGHPQNLKGKS